MDAEILSHSKKHEIISTRMKSGPKNPGNVKNTALGVNIAETRVPTSHEVTSMAIESESKGIMLIADDNCLKVKPELVQSNAEQFILPDAIDETLATVKTEPNNELLFKGVGSSVCKTSTSSSRSEHDLNSLDEFPASTSSSVQTLDQNYVSSDESSTLDQEDDTHSEAQVEHMTPKDADLLSPLIRNDKSDDEESTVNNVNISVKKLENILPSGLSTNAFLQEIEASHMCNKCGEAFTSESDALEHFQTHTKKLQESYHARNTDETAVENSNCENVKNGKCSSTNHQPRRKEKPFKCDQCEKSYTKRAQLNIHIRVHSGLRPYQCGYCQKTFSRKNSMTRHVDSHSGRRPFKCDQCNKTFTLKQSLSFHQMLHTGEKPFECSRCGKAFARKPVMIEHLKTHEIEIQYRCKICYKAFKREKTHARHLRTHTEERLEKCLQCDKSFFLNRQLIEHMKTHAVEKPFKCNQCDKAFVRKSSLSSHLQTHTGMKSYKCELCDKTYVKVHSLLVHLRSHTGEKPYKCFQCDKKYVANCSLQEHLKKHSVGGEP